MVFLLKSQILQKIYLLFVNRWPTISVYIRYDGIAEKEELVENASMRHLL